MIISFMPANLKNDARKAVAYKFSCCSIPPLKCSDAPSFETLKAAQIQKHLSLLIHFVIRKENQFYVNFVSD